MYKRSQGQSLVEFALIGTILLTMLLGVADFGIAFFARIVIQNAVAEGGYWAFQHPRDDVTTRNVVIQEAARQGITLQPSNITLSCAGSNGTEQTTITLVYDHPLLFTFIIPSSRVRMAEHTIMPQLGGC